MKQKAQFCCLLLCFCFVNLCVCVSVVCLFILFVSFFIFSFLFLVVVNVLLININIYLCSISANATLIQVCRGELGTFGGKIHFGDSGCATTQKLCTFSHPHPHTAGRGHRPPDETAAAAECHERSLIVHMNNCLHESKEAIEVETGSPWSHFH